jgi:hypothetical protein
VVDGVKRLDLAGVTLGASLAGAGFYAWYRWWVKAPAIKDAMRRHPAGKAVPQAVVPWCRRAEVHESHWFEVGGHPELGRYFCPGRSATSTEPEEEDWVFLSPTPPEDTGSVTSGWRELLQRPITFGIPWHDNVAMPEQPPRDVAALPEGRCDTTRPHRPHVWTHWQLEIWCEGVGGPHTWP